MLRRTNVLPPDGQLADAETAQCQLAAEIAQLIDGIPLALDQAGSYIEETGCDLGHYLRLFKQQRSRLLNQRGGSALDHPEPTATTWNLAFQKIQQHSEVARDLLYLCAFLHPDAIYRELIQQGAQALGFALRNSFSDPVALDQAIAELRKYSILRKTDHSHTLTIHRLVQDVIKESLHPLLQHTWAESTVLLINATFPNISASDWLRTRIVARKYYVHAQTALDIANNWQLDFPEVAQLLSKVGKYLEETSDFEEAEKCYLRAIALDEQLNTISADTLTLDYNNLASLYEHQEKYRQAEEYYKKAISSRRDEITSDRFTPAILETIRNYTTFLMKFEQRKNEANRLRARTSSQISQSVRRITINDDHPDITYHGSWETRSEQQGHKSGDYGGNTHYTNSEGAAFEYEFTGFGIAILSDTASAQGIIDIYIDDRYVQRKDTSQDLEQQPQTIIYHQDNLEPGPHKLSGEIVRGAFALDALVIFIYDQ
ncbi:hypothetical protein KDW_59200 [Dictyobacter vulcani]|uniref:DUF7779 domain-containing protein n=1 Tax=Dictyobacter vulcani TaxID=2607529 RepID=A0A5J4KPY3_9CHLR|nr:tetratricopeptide repeat protein [Dictyobacter vulcani]GER91758.1 hypothetical protein KDW_59200 [Dictyobacter vulcani]